MIRSLLVAAVTLAAGSVSAQIVISVGQTTVDAGAVATFEVTLSGVQDGGIPVNDARLDIVFPTAVFDVVSAAVCTLNPRLANMNHTESLPSLPDPGVGNRRLRLNIIDAVAPFGEVTDGPLYSCSFPVKTTAPGGSIMLIAERQSVGDTGGNVLPSTTINGVVVVVRSDTVTPTESPTATPTPTVEATPSRTAGGAPTPTATPAGSATTSPATATSTVPVGATNTPGSGSSGGGGCQMASYGGTDSWTLFMATIVAAIVALMRRQKPRRIVEAQHAAVPG